MVGYSIKKLLDPQALKSVTPEMKKAFGNDGAANILRALQDRCNDVPTGPGITNAWTEEEVNQVTFKHVPSWPDLRDAVNSEKVGAEGKCTNILCFSSGCTHEGCQFASSHESTQLLPVGVRSNIGFPSCDADLSEMGRKCYWDLDWSSKRCTPSKIADIPLADLKRDGKYQGPVPLSR